MKLDIQLFADGKVRIDTELDTRNFENGLDKMKTSTAKGGNALKSIIAGLGITKMIGMAMSQITGSIDSAISRVDTLNQFPKVMSNLGIGAEDAQKSIEKMSEKLSGLPTTLDQGARAVQRFTSKNNDVAKSTDLFLALNNAILAGGSNSEIQASALEQLSQAYAKGKPDMMEWRTAMTAMPAQLKQVATAMGYVDADALGEALRKGDASMDDFMATITKLNTEGVNGFASFEEQARNSTGGIQTAIIVAKTQVVKGVADIIEGINKGLEQADLPSITEIIATLGKKAKEVIDKVAENIPTIIQNLVDLYAKIEPFLPVITSIGAMILTAITAWTTYQKILKIVTAVQTAFNIVMSANPIALIIIAIVALVAGFVVLWKKSEKFRNFWIGLWEGIKNAVSTAINFITNIFTTIINFVKNNWKGLLLLLVNPFAGAFKLLYDNVDGFRNFIDNAISSIIGFFKSIPEKVGEFINATIEFIKNIPYYVGYVIGLIIGGIINLGIKLYEFFTVTVPEFINGVIEWFKELPSKIGEFLLGVWEKLKELGLKLYEFFTVTVPEFINGIVEWFKQLPGKIWEALLSVIAKVGEWLNNMYNKAKVGIQNLVNSIVQWFKDLPENMKNIGKNIVKGIWNGITNAKDWLLGKIKDFAKGITDGIKKALGIKSPSRVMRDEVGKYLAQGIGVGFEDELDKVYRSMKNAINIEQSKLQANVETGKVFNALQNSTPVAIDINADVEMDSTKVGRLVTPVISKTIKTGGGV